MSQIKERPILFSAPMVRAILEDRKTVTRRPVKGTALKWLEEFVPEFVVHSANGLCPYGKLGDRLWVRESFWGCDLPGYGDQPCVVYDDEWHGKEYKPAEARPWARKFGRIPSIHMPREASRILLEITAVRVERLQDISRSDIRAEGLQCPPELASDDIFPNYRDWYPAAWRELWESINGADSWNANPWVWVVEFKRVTP